MLLIAHRGNVGGNNPHRENAPTYIDEALNLRFNAEVDIWYDKKKWWLGHDEPQHKIDAHWLNNRGTMLWLHCKNLGALTRFADGDMGVGHYMPNYFWHQNDNFTLTSHGFIWTFPGQPLTKNSVCVLPEKAEYTVTQLKNCWAICSDHITSYQYPV